ncbi:MAG: alpha-glucan family phosphorylase [Phycisphaeraceae bacterium]
MINPELARIHSFEVVPSLPEPLQPLLRIAYNLWWSWHPEAVELFVRLDRNLWRESHHNPVKMLGMVPQQTLDAFARDEGYLTSLSRAEENLDRHLSRRPWHETRDPKSKSDDFTIAYFCAEFGLTECLQIYSGGLGCLAGDHLKSASELGLPLVAVGLLYRNGYFQQYLNADGWQQEYTPELDMANLPVRPVTGDDGKQVRVKVQMPGRDVHIVVWKAIVGRIPLYLLDTNVAENDEADRHITSQLYGGDMETRIKQEIVLGIGGTRALDALGIRPDICHLNEGHSAFLALERIRMLIEERDVNFDEARQLAAAGHVFTTHTPVPAGIDRFPPDMIERYFRAYHGALKLDMEGLLALGRENVFNRNEFFSMAVLAIRTSDWANGVSELHGHVSRHMWRNIWPNVPEQEVPITHVTNGVHARSWLSADLMYLLDRYLGARWADKPADQSVWEAINEVPDEELWRVHERRRQRLIVWARRALKRQLEARGTDPDKVRQATEALNPDALTIGFARRFATYKRGTLMMRDVQRLERILMDADRPVQFLIAGKAHPHDAGGKELIRQIVKFARESKAPHRIVFLENYDIEVARYLVEGCDVWLNTPRRGMEASGTSGMKAALNGVLNCSILDGWWDEAYGNDLGWAIGRREEYANPQTADDLESQALYDLLEKEIIPLFYDRDEHHMPRRWVSRMKKCIATLAPRFNTNRMVQEYAEKLYLPSLERTQMLAANDMANAIKLAKQKQRMRAAWGKIRIETVEAKTEKPLGVREKLPIEVVVNLGDLQPDELAVQVYAGTLDNDNRLIEGRRYNLEHAEKLKDGRHRFKGQIEARNSGRHGFAIRVVPSGELFDGILEPGLIHWEGIGGEAPAKAGKAEKVA